MRFALTPEQQAFATSLRAALADAGTPAAVRAWAADDFGPGRAVLRRLADSGVTALLVPAQFDGLGADPVDLVVAFVEIGRALVPGPVIETAAIAPTLLTGDLAAEWLPQIAAGSALVSTAVADRHPRALDADLADLVLAVGPDTVTLATPGTRHRSIDPARRLFDVEPAGPATDTPVTRAVDTGVLAAAAELLGAGRAVL
ncbi:acyl-CoA dehydrogenase family protein, partial [Skermania pinensis]